MGTRTMGEVIKALRLEHGLTQEQFAKVFHISPSTVGMWENNKRSPSNEMQDSIADYFNVDMDFLHGRTLIRNKTRELGTLPTNIIPIPEMKKVPMLGSVACGEPIYMDEVRGEYFPLDSSIHADFCLKAHGDSMTGARIYDGDIVFIQSSPMVENGQIAAVAIDDEATLKYFFQYGDTVVLRPANSKYEEMTYSREELNHIRILGRAVAFQSAL
ncbi:LexA family transcriptional regulator [uncultured Faecalibaculum sp.]|uniref:LexA family protein n=1 Tax=uncultured Faecalibaculum sp. TaxID=1729681 RepID=UPI0025EE31B7|nr:XRE family transcriptional regulator [uncultured Faecalibaculum sp.]